MGEKLKKISGLPWERLDEREYASYFNPAESPELKRDYYLQKLVSAGTPGEKRKLIAKLSKSASQKLGQRKKKFPWVHLDPVIEEAIINTIKENENANIPSPTFLENIIEKLQVRTTNVDWQEKLEKVLGEIKPIVSDGPGPILTEIGPIEGDLKSLEAEISKFNSEDSGSLSDEERETLSKEINKLIELLSKKLKKLITQLNIFLCLWAALIGSDEKKEGKKSKSIKKAMKKLPFYLDQKQSQTLDKETNDENTDDEIAENFGEDSIPAGVYLIHIDSIGTPGPVRFIWFLKRKEIYLLDGNSKIIRNLNSLKGYIDLRTELHAEEYLRFFCEHIRGDDGAFNLTEEGPEESTEEDSFLNDLLIRAEDQRQEENKSLKNPYRAEVAMPITMYPKIGDENKDVKNFTTTVIYGIYVYRACFIVHLKTGLVEMPGDMPIGGCALNPINLRWQGREISSYNLDFDETAQNIRVLNGGRVEQGDQDDVQLASDYDKASNEARMVKPADERVMWRNASNFEKRQIKRLSEKGHLNDDLLERLIANDELIAVKDMPYYNNSLLVHISEKEDVSGRAYRFIFNMDDDEIHILRTQSDVIHQNNASNLLIIDDDTALEYLRFFCEHVHGEEGGFYLLEENVEKFEMVFPENLEISGLLMADETLDGEIGDDLGQALELFIDSSGKHLADATVVYGGYVFKATFEIQKSGMIEMVNDNPVNGVTAKLNTPPWKPISKSDLDK